MYTVVYIVSSQPFPPSVLQIKPISRFQLYSPLFVMKQFTASFNECGLNKHEVFCMAVCGMAPPDKLFEIFTKSALSIATVSGS